MEQRSIYDFIRENLNFNGQICNDCDLQEYMINVFGKDYDNFEDNQYKKPDEFDWLNEQLSETQKIEFRLRVLIGKTVKALDSSELENYLSTNTYKFILEKDMILKEIEDNILDLDQSKVIEFCKENFIKTKNPYCMYIYILILSFIEFKKDEELQKIILLIALLPEFTLIINDFLIDKLEYPEYARLYLAKRVKKYTCDLMLKISAYSDEVKKWILLKVIPANTIDNNIIKLINKIDLLSILKKWDIDFKLYDAIGKAIIIISHDLNHNPSIENWYDIFIQYLSLYKNYEFNIDLFIQIVNSLNSILKTKEIEDNTKKRITQEYRNILVNDELIDKFKQLLCDDDTPKYIIDKIYDAVDILNISELYLKMYNEYAVDPLSHSSFIFHFKNNKEIYEKALQKLYDAIDWDSIIGEFNNVQDTFSNNDPVRDILMGTTNCSVDLAMKIYSKTIRAKDLKYRDYTGILLSSLLSKLLEEDKYLSNELIENIQYTYKNELNMKLKKELAYILDIREDTSDMTFSQVMTESKITSSLNLVGKNDEEINNQLAKEKVEEKRLNLNSHLFGKLDLTQCFKGVNILVSGKLIFVEFLKNEVFAFCQGDEFGKEYTIKLQHDDDYFLTDAMCTCGKSEKNNYCKHILGLFMYLSKLYDSKHPKEENS